MSLRLLSKPIAAVSAVALGLGMLVGAAGFTASHAADNPQIKVAPAALVRADRANNVIDGPIPLDEIALMKFTWDARNADVQPGQSFSVNLGPNFRAIAAGGSFGVKVGTKEAMRCAVTPEQFTCTFTPAIADLKQSHPHDLHGDGRLQLQAVQATDDPHVSMNFNGTDVNVPLPGPEGKIIARAPGQFSLAKFQKTSTPIGEKTKRIPWEITFSIDHLNQEREKQGLEPIPTDGTPYTIVIEDRLGAGQHFSPKAAPGETDPSKLPEFRLSKRSADDKNNVVLVYQGVNKNALVTTPGWALVSQTNESHTFASVALTGVFEKGVNYTLLAPGLVVGGTPVLGFDYNNTAKIAGMDLSVAAQPQRREQAFGVTINMRPGFGIFNFAKALSGDAADKVAPDTAYKVIAKYRLPGDTTVDDYAADQTPYRYPGVLDPDRKGGTITLMVEPGKKAYPTGQLPTDSEPAIAPLPENTVVTFEEPKGELPVIAGTQWEDPVFKLKNAVADSVTIGNQNDQSVQLQNRLNYVTKQFSIKKTVAGLTGGTTFGPFEFQYVCESGANGHVKVPGDGASHTVDVQVPANDRCTITEEPEKTPIAGFALTDVPDPVTLDMNTANPTAEFTNTYAPGGQVVVSKAVEGVDEGAVLGKAFPFELTCTVGADTVTQKGFVKLGSTWTSTMMPAGTQCTVTEDEGASAVPGYTLTTAPKAVEIQAGEPIANVELKNTYVKDVGSIKVAKAVEGLQGDDGNDKSYSIKVACLLSGTTTLNLKDGQSEVVGDLEVGDLCKISEDKDAAAVNGYELQDPVISKPTVRVEKGVTTEVSVTNTYSLKPGSLTVTKNLDVAIGTSFANEKFTINVSCDSNPAINETLSLGHDEKKTISNIPAGSVCTVTEDAPDKDGYTKTVKLPADTTIKPGEETSVVVTNIYDEKPGTLVIRKVLNDPKGAIAAGTTFPISYECGPGITGTVNLAANAEHRVENVPAGLTCTVTETPTAVDGFTPRVDIQGSPVEITRNATSTVTVTNSYDEKPGTLVITKKLVDSNGAIAQGTTFPISYNCGDGANMSGTVNLAADGEHRVENIPAGRTCTVLEAATKVDGFTETVNIQGSPVQITRNANASVTVTNTYTRDTGSLVIAKNLVAPDNAPFAGHEFEIGYSCDADGFRNKTVNVAGGNSVTVDGIPSGTVCTVTETAPTFVGYTGAANIDHQQVTIAKGAASNVTVTNTYTRDKGSLSITKKVEAEDGAPFAGRAFDITYTCGDPANPVTTGTVSLANGASETISDIPTGTECVVEESVASAHQKGYANTVAIEPARQVIAKDAVAAVTVTNRYAPLSGSFVISKSVAGDGAEKAKGKTFTFDYECTDLYGASQGKKTVELAEGANVSIDTRPGSCVISEQAAPIENTSHEVAFVVNGQDYGKGPITIDIPEAGEPVNVGVVNTYSLDRGIFTIAKTVTGVPSAASNTFEFDYVCTDGAKGKVQVKGDGVPVQAGDPMPVGTECTFTENASVAEIPGYDLVVADPQKGVISAQDDVVALKFVNAYSKKPVVTPEQPKPDQPKPEQPQTDQGKTNPKAGGKGGTDSPKADGSGKRVSGKLASTGSTAMTVVGIAAVALILGGLITWMVRRRK